MQNSAKLIVCDVDGTLLKKSEKRINPAVFDMICSVKNAGISFAVASGRSKNDLQRLFANLDIFYICSDGSYAEKSGVKFFAEPISQNVISVLLSKLSGCDFALYGSDFCYAGSESILNQVKDNENGKVLPISDFKEVTPVYKLAVKDTSPKAAYAMHYIEANRLLRPCYRGSVWSEYVAVNTDKGMTLAALQERLGIKYEETAVFGDNLNDIPMLKKAYFSYAVGGSRPEVKAMARFFAEDAAKEIVKKFLK